MLRGDGLSITPGLPWPRVQLFAFLLACPQLWDLSSFASPDALHFGEHAEPVNKSDMFLHPLARWNAMGGTQRQASTAKSACKSF